MRNIYFSLLALVFFGNSYAAPLYSGLWGIEEELNGKPGRGVQIEQQDAVTVISYYGYRNNGTSVFYQATSLIEDEKHFAADLIEYKNGPAIAGDIKIGEFAQNIGAVNITFTSANEGIITLPGEKNKKIKKLILSSSKDKYNHNFKAISIPADGSGDFSSSVNYKLALTDGSFRLRVGTDSGFCDYIGNFVDKGGEISSVGYQACGPTSIGVNLYYKISNLFIDRHGNLNFKISNNLKTRPDDEFEMVNPLFVFGVCTDC